MIRPRRRYVKAAGKQRLVVAPELLIAIDRSATEVCAVITILQADELGATCIATNLVILARQFQRDLN